MNCEQANNIRIREVLYSLGKTEQKKRNSFQFYYFAINREEKIPSLLVDYMKNSAYDFGQGKYYSVIDIVVESKRCSITEALEYLDSFSFSFNKQEKRIYETANKPLEEKPNPVEIVRISSVKNSALLQYLKKRGVFEERHKLKEIAYRANNKEYFGVAFKNNSGGYEIRNKYSKANINGKDVTFIDNQSAILIVFEGFTDYLSFCKKNKPKENMYNYLIMNSSALKKRCLDYIARHKHNLFFLDNDKTGKECFAFFNTYFFCVQNNFINDLSSLYNKYNDYNEYFLAEFFLKK